MINNWSSYKSWIGDAVKNGMNYYYRGQRKPQWKLQTSFHRYAGPQNISMVQYLDVILPEVSYYVSATQQHNINLSDSAEFGALLARLQHHGFPTPLLDWTMSPYIAAYFALKDVNPSNPDTRHVSILIFDMDLWARTYPQPLDLRSQNPFVSSFKPNANNNPRLVQQMAATTATNVLDMGSFITECQKATGMQFLYEISLPVSERKLIMNELNLMGINSMTMFPDFDGICSSMKELYFNNLEIKPLVPAPPPPPAPSA